MKTDLSFLAAHPDLMNKAAQELRLARLRAECPGPCKQSEILQKYAGLKLQREQRRVDSYKPPGYISPYG